MASSLLYVLAGIASISQLVIADNVNYSKCGLSPDLPDKSCRGIYEKTQAVME